MRRVLITVLAAAGMTAALMPGGALAARQQAQPNAYVVLYGSGASTAAARLAVRIAGGTIVNENADVGVATVWSLSSTFLTDVMKQPALAGASRNAPVGVEAPLQRASKDQIEKLVAERGNISSNNGPRVAAKGDPLAGLQWDMAMLHATADGSYRKQPGDRRVLVGIIDTGVDGSHPDIAPNFSNALSRNFTTDIPLIDGPCADEPDHSCSDPANVDEDGHGTHVAGTVGASLNGIGIAGVAPNVTLVNIRAGQDSGYFFLQPTIDALTYAANTGVDVVNMSYYIDPWLYNCANNPADSPTAQMEQRTIVAATNRALDYAYAHGVTLIGALGNSHTDLGNPTFDGSSPDFPPGAEYNRTVDNSCLDMPQEGNHVMGVGSVGPTTMKADYSNWGSEQTDVTAPGGYFRDGFGTPSYRSVTNLILSAYPESLAIANGDLNPDGSPNNAFVVRDCQKGVCAYYQYLQGTSMASPHAVGVAALIVSEYGDDGPGGQRTLAPSTVQRILEGTATDHACPTPPLITYTAVGRSPAYNALCTGTTARNSIWGDGIVDALAAVTQDGNH